MYTNFVASALRKFGIFLAVCGVIAGIYYGNNIVKLSILAKDEFSWMTFFTWTIYGGVAYAGCYAFAEVIELLQRICDRVEESRVKSVD